MDGKSDFIKKAYKQNRVKDVKEAFKEYSVEKEWHKGKEENVLREIGEVHRLSYNIGDIVFAKKYTYANGKKGTKHFW